MEESEIKKTIDAGQKTANYLSESEKLLESSAENYCNMISPLYSGEAGILSYLKKEFVNDTYEGRLKRIVAAINVAMERERCSSKK